jgi:hypothetical protein
VAVHAPPLVTSAVTLVNAWCSSPQPGYQQPADATCPAPPLPAISSVAAPGPDSSMGASAAGPAHDQYSPAQRTRPGRLSSATLGLATRWHPQRGKAPPMTRTAFRPIAAYLAGRPAAATPA